MTDYRLRTLAAGFFAVALVGSVLTGCKKSGASNDTFDNGVDSLTWCTISFEDSVSVLDASAYQQMAADFPIDVDTAVMDAGTRAAIEWVANTLQNCSYPDYDGSGRKDKLMPVPAMDEAELETFVARCGRIGLDSMKADMREMAEDGFGGSYLNNIKIELTEQTPSYLTLTFGHEVYTGGAHGGWITNGATFNRATGEQMGWNLFDMSKEQELRAMLIRGVKSYFNDFSEEKIETDEQLYELLILYDEAPVSIKNRSIDFENVGHLSKSTVENPVVEIIVATWKKESLVKSDIFSYVEYKFEKISKVDTPIMPKYVHNSEVFKASFERFIISR